MGLPINIQELLNGETVEWERIECKGGWNPENVVRSIGAFANDINNWGGGYIFIGIAEKDGLPQLPPVGISQQSIDSIQKELLALSHKIQPYYAPVIQPYVIGGKHILVIWVPGGDNRPYKVPSTFGEKGQHRYYVRRGSSSVIATGQEETLLLEMAKRIPFDDRVNHQAGLEDLSFGLLRDFLEEVKSDLAKEAPQMSLKDLTLQMRIASGPTEALFPLNAGLMFFSERPEIHFKGATTDIVLYGDLSGTTFTEKKFTGPLHLQLRSVLSFIQNNIIKEKIIKSPERAEAKRIYNYPFAALEEVVANAFYHRSYEVQNPIEINSFPDRIEVLSFPGPLPPVSKVALKQKRIVARNYRNRRVGDFLKELKLTEGRATGFPTIYDSMQQNGSSKPVFETDDNYAYFLALLPVHSAFSVQQIGKERPAIAIDAATVKILDYCLTPRKRVEVLSAIGLSNQTKNFTAYMEPLLSNGWLSLIYPASPNSPQQQYVTTPVGKQILVTK